MLIALMFLPVSGDKPLMWNCRIPGTCEPPRLSCPLWWCSLVERHAFEFVASLFRNWSDCFLLTPDLGLQGSLPWLPSLIYAPCLRCLSLPTGKVPSALFSFIHHSQDLFSILWHWAGLLDGFMSSASPFIYLLICFRNSLTDIFILCAGHCVKCWVHGTYDTDVISVPI